MEDALLANLPCPSIRTINCCHIAHQALYWSDVANGWGDSISLGMLWPPASSQHSSWTWPPERPSCSDWAIWATFLKDSPHISNGYLIVPLGPWIHHTHCLDFIPFHLPTQLAYVQGHRQFWHQFPPFQPVAIKSLKLIPVNSPQFPFPHQPLGTGGKQPYPVTCPVWLSSLITTFPTYTAAMATAIIPLP